MAVVAVVVVANYAESHPDLRVVAYIAQGFIALLGGLLGLANALLVTGATRRSYAGAAVAVISIPLAIAVMMPVARQALARLVKEFNPASSVNAVAASLYIVVFMEQLSSQVSVDQIATLSQVKSSPSLPFLLATNQLPMVIVAAAGVGLLMRRGLRPAMDRLGLFWPGWRWIGASVGVAVGLIIFGVAFDRLMSVATPQTSQSIQEITNQLLKSVNSYGALVALALGAGIGEELLFRGALLPRFGNVLTSLLFAALHTQYGVTLATLEIFILGLVLGWLRRRAGTTGCIITHTLYDIVAGIGLVH